MSKKIIAIETSQTGNRRFTAQKRFNDDSGHSHILDMLTEMAKEGWTVAEVTNAAFESLWETWTRGDLSVEPLYSKPQVVTHDMRQASTKLLELVHTLSTLIENGGLVGSMPADMQSNLEEIRSSLEVNTLEGASVYASEIMEIKEIDEGWDDE